MEHLSKEASLRLSQSIEQRVDYINSDKWIGYTRCGEILSRMTDLLNYPHTHRMPNLILVGETNNGKTAILRRFVQNHPSYHMNESENLILPVLYVQAPPFPDEKRLYNSILDKLYISYKANERVEKKEMQITSVLSHLQTRMLIIDEFQHILSGTVTKQRGFLNVIKYLSNELKISIVAAGVKEAMRAISIDTQLSNRFEPAILPRWKMNEEYMRLLASFEYMLPLKHPSNLADDTIAIKLLNMSEGLIGELSTILKRAAIRSIKDGTEKITKKTLDSIDWKSPENRRKEIHSV